MAHPQPSYLALTMGDPTGIGPELTLMAWLSRRERAIPPFIYLGDAHQLEDLAERLDMAAPIMSVNSVPDSIETFDRHIPVFNCPLTTHAVSGSPDTAHVPSIASALDTAVDLVSTHRVSAMVTNPIHKDTMWQGGFAYPGHTEYLADRAAAPGETCHAVMMLMSPQLRVVPVTIHLPLKDVGGALTTEAIIRVGRVTHDALERDLGINQPLIGVSGLNPHAGEGGSLGTEERDVIAPAVGALRAQNVNAEGPYAADALFAERSRQRYDAIICMYHDQALIPLKTLDFDRGVNVTLGLPFVRTSPDHGTAHDIAGLGRANPESLIMALTVAQQMGRH